MHRVQRCGAEILRAACGRQVHLVPALRCANRWRRSQQPQRTVNREGAVNVADHLSPQASAGQCQATSNCVARPAHLPPGCTQLLVPAGCPARRKTFAAAQTRTPRYGHVTHAVRVCLFAVHTTRPGAYLYRSVTLAVEDPGTCKSGLLHQSWCCGSTQGRARTGPCEHNATPELAEMGAMGGMCGASCQSYTAHKPEPCALAQRMQGSKNSPQACQHVRAWPTCRSPSVQACGANAPRTQGPQAWPSPRQRMPGPQGGTCPLVHVQRTQRFCHVQLMPFSLFQVMWLGRSARPYLEPVLLALRRGKRLDQGHTERHLTLRDQHG
jgi:hypothetical protein